MDKIKRFIELYVPVTTCTLRCDYCYITRNGLFGSKLPELDYSPQYVRKALSVKRLGGRCLVNFCGGGETLLAPHITEYIRELLEEGHYVSVVTNATTTNEFEIMAHFPKELLSHLFFKFSYHYLELKKRGLLDRFFGNIRKMRDAGASFTLEATPSDEWIPYIQEMKQMAIDNVGAACHITVARDTVDKSKLPILTSMTKKDYVRTWSVFDSELFRYKMSIFEVPRKEFCYAGAWSMCLNLQTGDAKQCYKSDSIQNVFKDLTVPILWRPIGHHCKEHHCYNGHSFIVLGLIPKLCANAPTYAQERNRVCLDGSEWLGSEMKQFMSSRLYESNKEYGFIRRLYSDIIQTDIFLKIRSKIGF